MKDLLGVPCAICQKIVFADVLSLAGSIEQMMVANPGKRIDLVCSAPCQAILEEKSCPFEEDLPEFHHLVEDLLLP